MDRGLYNLVVFLDLKKAFGMVPWIMRFLKKKLMAHGIADSAIKLLSSYFRS